MNGNENINQDLISRSIITVRFNESDPLGIVWHGHYIQYFEDGREDFCKAHGFSYLDVFENGFVTPIVSVNCDYKKPLRYGDKVIVETIYIPTKAAKLIFDYRLYNSKDQQLVATGSTTQVFLDKKNMELQLTTPHFFSEWKKKFNI